MTWIWGILQQANWKIYAGIGIALILLFVGLDIRRAYKEAAHAQELERTVEEQQLKIQKYIDEIERHQKVVEDKEKKKDNTRQIINRSRKTVAEIYEKNPNITNDRVPTSILQTLANARSEANAAR
jgi:predicted Holliday junction resolvase-like endonuclease